MEHQGQSGQVMVWESGEGIYTQMIEANGHRLRADEPEDQGGDDHGPSPYDLLLASLGACTAMTLRMYANQKQWPLDRVTVTLRHAKIHAEDCAACETRSGWLDRIERNIHLDGSLTPEQRQRMMEIADKCPIHRTLHSEVLVVSQLVTDQP